VTVPVALEVVRAGPLALVEDLGRPGQAGIGVGRSGAADRGAFALGNRLVGNRETAAAVEITLGGFEAVARGGDLWFALTGAPAPVTMGGRQGAPRTLERLRDGQSLCLGTPAYGLRSYLAVRGGLDAAAVLGSRSTDVLSGLGPAPLSVGDTIDIGTDAADFPPIDHAPAPGRGDATVVLRVVRGPRDDWVEDADALVRTSWTISDRSNRIGMRLDGGSLPPATARADQQLPSEGAYRGAVQVPPNGEPVVFLADHPVTGGYPVVAVVVDADVDVAAQARPGEEVGFRWVRP